MATTKDDGTAPELCDWCGQAVDDDTKIVAASNNGWGDRAGVVLTACSLEHLRELPNRG